MDDKLYLLCWSIKSDISVSQFGTADATVIKEMVQKTTERQAEKDNKQQKSQQAGRWEDVKQGDPEKLDKKVRFAPPQLLQCCFISPGLRRTQLSEAQEYWLRTIKTTLVVFGLVLRQRLNDPLQKYQKKTVPRQQQKLGSWEAFHGADIINLGFKKGPVLSSREAIHIGRCSKLWTV